MSLKLLVCAGLFIGFQSASALAQEPASTEPKQEPGPQASQAAEPAPAVPAAEPVQPPAAAPESAPTPAAPATAPVAAAAPAAQPLPAARTQVADAERAPDNQVVPPPPGAYVRLALGVGVQLLVLHGATDLRVPSAVQLDVGYAFTPDLAALLRVSTWLSFEKYAQQFLGAGARFGVAPDNMYVSALLGLNLYAAEGAFQGETDVQGLSAQLEVGQTFVLSGALRLEVAVTLAIGTPLFGEIDGLWSVGIGPFLALRFGG